MESSTKNEIKQRICQLIERGHTDKQNIAIIVSDEYNLSRWRVNKIINEHKDNLQSKLDVLNNGIAIESE